jgi:hypothetical protein
MKEVFKCRERRMMRQDEVWKKGQAWGCPCHPKKYPRGTSVKAWGCPEAVTPEFPEIQSARYVFHHNPRIIVVIHIT